MDTERHQGASSGSVISFSLHRRSYAVPVELVSGLAEPGEVRNVPGAPEGVLGLGEWRGRLLTVLDLPFLLDDRPAQAEPCLLRLAKPLDHIALLVPATVKLRSLTPGTAGPVLLDPSTLVARLESELLSVGPGA